MHNNVYGHPHLRKPRPALAMECLQVPSVQACFHGISNSIFADVNTMRQCSSSPRVESQRWVWNLNCIHFPCHNEISPAKFGNYRVSLRPHAGSYALSRFPPFRSTPTLFLNFSLLSLSQDQMKLYYVCTAEDCGHRWTE